MLASNIKKTDETVEKTDKVVEKSAENVEKTPEKALLLLKFIKKKLQLDGTIKKIKEATNGALKKSERKKTKAIAVIKRKIAIVKAKKHKVVKTSTIINGSAFRVEIHKAHINVYENRRPNEIFASQARDIDQNSPDTRITQKDMEFISYYIY